MGWTFLKDEDANYSMADGEEVYIGSSVDLIGGADTMTATLYSGYAGAHAVINGSLAGTYTIKFGEDLTAAGHHVEIGSRGDIFSTHTGLLMRGVSNLLNNRGTIMAEAEAVYIHAGTADDYSRVKNSGEIVGGYVGIGAMSAQSIHINNTGLIEGGTYSIALGTAADRVINSGELQGDLFFDDGNDYYDGRKGTISGLITGDMGNDEILGGAGDEAMDGGVGTDSLTGGSGQDTLTGGSEADRFIFAAVTDTSRLLAQADHITDFSSAQLDIIDLDDIDANLGKTGDQDFRFLGTKTFSGAAGELRYAVEGSDIVVMGDVDGDRKADFLIVLDDLNSITKASFDL